MYDKTEQYRDLNIRLNNLITFKKRYEKLLTVAKTVDEMLKLEKEIERVTGEIELIKGKIEYLENQVAYSTLTQVCQNLIHFKRYEVKIS
jgi:phage-related minor tail protein